MADAAAEKPRKEAPVLSDVSLGILAGEVGDPLKFGMMLSIPNTTIVHFQLEAADKKTPAKDLATKIIMHWKKCRAEAKNGEKVNDLERALRELGKHELADILRDRHGNSLELSADAFVQ